MCKSSLTVSLNILQILLDTDPLEAVNSHVAALPPLTAAVIIPQRRSFLSVLR